MEDGEHDDEDRLDVCRLQVFGLAVLNDCADHQGQNASECNCMTFCPEDGDPAMVKPRLYTDVSFDLIEPLLESQKGDPLG